VTGFGKIFADLVAALREDLADVLRDADDAPVAQIPRRAVVRRDVKAELDRPGHGVPPTDHRGGFQRVGQGPAVEGLVPAGGVEHFDDVGDQHVVVGRRVPGP
jgi:hypothetical protein